MTTYSAQQLYCLQFLHAHQENSKVIKKQLQTHQKQAQLGLLASQMMSHMATKASSMPIPISPTTCTPPCSPPITTAGLPSLAVPTAVSQARFNQPPTRSREPKVRYAPYTTTSTANVTSTPALRRAAKDMDSAAFVNTPPLSPSHQADHQQTQQQQQPASPPQSIRTTSAESIQIQKIVMTALSTLRLPSHTVIMALFFVHKMLTAAISSNTSFTSAFPSIAQTESPATAEFARNPVALFTAGLILADSMLCDAPVSISTWTWILSQSCPPFSAMASKLYATYARDLKRWALNLLDFDLNVPVELYGEWMAGVKRFLDGQGALQKLQKHVKQQQQQMLQHTHDIRNLSFYAF
ncbi:hypothetical protein BJ741DRAFT_594638 [Chytriomyces cf. hyalinus JEL632]|nr:hypothetical protein BJ741DRAFT_594638 [Chytriomyces cf. hyalinus JEL632]